MTSLDNIKDKVILISGAASGIGFALASKLAAAQAQLILCDIDQKRLDAAANQLRLQGGHITAFCCDVSQPEAVAQLRQEVFKQFGALHCLINNAGVFGMVAPIWEVPLETLQWTLDGNLMSVIYMLQAFVPIMLETQGWRHIVNVASILGLESHPGHSCYQISKHGVVTLSKTLQLDFAQRDIDIGVSVFCPGFVNTNLLNLGRNKSRNIQAILANHPYSAHDKKIIAAAKAAIQHGISPIAAADSLIQGMLHKQFLIKES